MGIYGFLRFLRTTRGSGLMRGLVLTLLLGLVALAGLAKVLDLLELEKLIESFTPSIAVILVILFQPELRRIISQVGEQNRLGRLLSKGQEETVNEVVQSVSAMAGRNVGALIAFEREFALDEYTHNAVTLDSKVNRLTLESIFHPGSSLHDGAVVIRGDRIVAAACLFPLTDNAELSKSTGTRHRAALGLSDETDAVAVIVSEETGQIAVCRRGTIENAVSAGGLEKILRDKLGLADKDASEKGTGSTRLRNFGEAVARIFTADIPRKLSALAFGALLVFIAHQEIATSESFSIQVKTTTGSSSESKHGALLVRVPSDDYHVESPDNNQLLRITVTGSSTAIAKLGGNLHGDIEVTADMVGNPTDLRLEMIDANWSNILGMQAEWADGKAPRLSVKKLVRQSFTLAPEHLEFDLSQLNPNYELLREQTEFSPDLISIKGPSDPEFALGSDELPLRLEVISIGADALSTREYRLGLHPKLEEAGYSIENDLTVEVTVQIAPFELEIGTVEQDIAISVLKGPREATSRWRLPARSETAKFTIVTRGILPAEIDHNSELWLEHTSAIRKFIEENVRVFVDVSGIEEGVGNEVSVEWKWRREWGDTADAASEPGRLELRLESEERVLLGENASSESSNGKALNNREGN